MTKPPLLWPASRALAGLFIAVVVTSCGSEPSAKQTAAPPASPSTPVAPTTSAPSPTPSATSGKLGTVVPAELGGDRYTVAALRYARFGDGGEIYGTVDVRLCVAKDNGRPITVSSGPWSLLYGESVMDEQVSGGGLKKPEYPTAVGGGTGRAVQPGKCLRGWIHFTLLDGRDPDAVEYSGETESGETFTYAWTI